MCISFRLFSLPDVFGRILLRLEVKIFFSHWLNEPLCFRYCNFKAKKEIAGQRKIAILEISHEN